MWTLLPSTAAVLGGLLVLATRQVVTQDKLTAATLAAILLTIGLADHFEFNFVDLNAHDMSAAQRWYAEVSSRPSAAPGT